MKLRTLYSKFPFIVLSTLAMLAWMFLFDGNNLIAHFRLWQKRQHLQDEKVYYTQKIADVQKESYEVLGTPKAAEQFAREKYYMKQENETVFVIVDKDGNFIEK